VDIFPANPRQVVSPLIADGRHTMQA